ncbi:DMT family transporter [Pantoea sp. UYEF8]|uniref:DMT family transporter n=1 Tax=Pantoea sp. UYEF8 TaxID=1756394 RepID=UPI00339635AA
MLMIMILLSLTGGCLLSIQAAINGKLGQEIGALHATFINFLSGTVLSVLLVMFLEPAHTQSLMDVPKWQLSGAFFGILYILLMIFAVRQIGTAVATVGVILGQLGMSLFIDTSGLFGNSAMPLTCNRIAALVLLIIALYFIFTSNRDQSQASG